MTLIKFNIENKTKEQRKKEVLNKLRKIQSMVESDANYTEMVYHIITNTSLQKKNMKVNLDHYGNYSVIDANNKIVGGGMFNSNGGNSSVQPSNSNKLSNTSQLNTTSMIPIINMNSKKTNTLNQNKKPTEETTISQETPVADTDQVTSQPIIMKDPGTSTVVNTKDVSNTSVPIKNNNTASKTTSNTGKNQAPENKDFLSSMFNTLSGKKDTEGTAEKASEQIGTESVAAKASETESTGTGTEGAAANASEQIDTKSAENSTETKKTGLFGFKLWGGKNKTMDNDSYPSFQTTVFNDGSEEIFMEHMKNMSSKKYLRSLTTQELKDIMRSNHMKVTHNGSYYNKEQMVNKVYQFYK